MAKIILITDDWNEEVENLCNSLNQQKKEIIVLTDSQSVIPDQLPFFVLRPFIKWNMTEALKVFIQFINFQPCVIHFLFSKSNSEHQVKVTSMHLALSTFANQIPSTKILISDFHSKEWKRGPRYKYLLRLAHGATCPSRMQVLNLRGLASDKQKLELSVIPSFNHSFDSLFIDETKQDPDLAQLIKNITPYILVPDWTDSLENDLWFLQKQMHILVLGPRPTHLQTDLKVTFLEEIKGTLHESLLWQKAHASLISYADYTFIELFHLYKFAQSFETPLLVNPRQLDSYPGLVIDNMTGWVLERAGLSIRRLFHENPKLLLNKKFPKKVPMEVLDDSMNELNRLYQKLLEIR